MSLPVFIFGGDARQARNGLFVLVPVNWEMVNTKLKESISSVLRAHERKCFAHTGSRSNPIPASIMTVPLQNVNV